MSVPERPYIDPLSGLMEQLVTPEFPGTGKNGGLPEWKEFMSFSETTDP